MPYKGQILIGDEVIWESEISVSRQTLSFDVERFSGVQNLRMRIVEVSSGPGPTPPDPWDSSPLTNWWRFSYSLADPANKNQRIIINEAGAGDVAAGTLTFFMIGRPLENWGAVLYPFLLTASYLGYPNLTAACHWMRHEQRVRTFSGPNLGAPANCAVAFDTFTPLTVGAPGSCFTNGEDGVLIIQVTGGVASGWFRSSDPLIGDQTGGPTAQTPQMCSGSGRMQLFGVENWGTHCWEGRLYAFGLLNRTLSSAERIGLLKWANDPANATNPPDLAGGAPGYYFDCNEAPAVTVPPHIDTLSFGNMTVNNHVKITLNG